MGLDNMDGSLWAVALCVVLAVRQRFGGTFWHHHQSEGRRLIVKKSSVNI
jgi:hypothetical protein